MRTTLVLLLLIPALSIAQLSGEISYTTTINMHKGLPDTERGNRMREFIPETTEFGNLLLFNGTETVYKNVHEEEDEVDLDAEADDQQNRFRKHMLKRMAPPNDIIYTDAEKGLVTRKKEFMDKTFLIRDTLEISQWKITGETKDLAGMNCMKAEFIPGEGDSTKVEVWFAPEIPVSSGPAGFGGLPGLIVYLNQDDGKLVISLNSIVMREIEKGEIEAPKKGKEVTQEEFDEIVMKKREQQRKQWSGRGGFHGH